MSARAFDTAGLTIEKAGKEELVSYQGMMPEGRTAFPSESKRAVRILYVCRLGVSSYSVTLLASG